MNDKVIIVKGWNEIEIQKIISDFTETYKNDGYQPYNIPAQKRGDDLFQLSFPKDIHPRLFTFLVNYITYPFDLDLKNRTIVVGAKTTLSAEFDGIESSFVGKKAILYVPPMIRITTWFICRQNPETVVRFHLLKWNGEESMMRGYRVM